MNYFTVREFERSVTAVKYGIDNSIKDKEVKDNIEALVDNVLDPLREYFGSPILVSSGYRCFSLNKKIGGARSSQHCKGEAADIYVEDGVVGLRRLLRCVLELDLPYDQLIWEKSGEGYWIHISHTRLKVNRKQCLCYDNGAYHTHTPEEMYVIFGKGEMPIKKS